MRVLAWVPEVRDISPGQRYRIEQWEPHLRKLGIELTFRPFVDESLGRDLHRPGGMMRKGMGLLRSLVSRVSQASVSRQFDLLYIFREGALLGPALAERLAARTGVPIVYDFDDAIWVRYVSPSNSYFSYLRFPGKTGTICRLARRVIVGNAYLRDYAVRFNQEVSVVPSTIDTEWYRVAARDPGREPVIGWTGSHSTEPYLDLVRPVLERLRRRRTFRMVVIGARGRFAPEGIDVEFKPWSSATEVTDLSELDVGIMPLPQGEWERGKCGMKALQYMALGLPVVASPVGANVEIIADGQNGHLARTEDDWEERLESLLDSAALRKSLGSAGRATVEKSYSALVHAPRVAELFRAAAA